PTGAAQWPAPGHWAWASTVVRGPVAGSPSRALLGLGPVLPGMAQWSWLGSFQRQAISRTVGGACSTRVVVSGPYRHDSAAIVFLKSFSSQ
ncbi:hypothetical protein TorRG33x02_102010, partial [Trema orientale]